MIGPLAPADIDRWRAYRPLLGRDGYAYRVPSGTRRGVTYTVVYRGGRASCNCWGSNGLRRECYHEKEVIALTQAMVPAEATSLELAPVPVERPRSLWPSPDELNAMTIIARNVPAAAGHAVPKGITAGQAFAVMLAGHEIGVGPMTAMRHITAINGRTEPDAQLMMGICLANDRTVRFTWNVLSRELADLDLWRGGSKVMNARYTIDDANAAGQLVRPTRKLWGPERGGPPIGEEEFDGPWQTHTMLMLAYNAIKIACKLGAPDLINNVAGVMGQLVATEMVTEGETMPWEGVGDLSGGGDFDTPRAAAREAAQPRGSKPAAPARGQGGPKPRQLPPRPVLHKQVTDALAEKGVGGATLAKYLGGPGKIADVEQWLRENPAASVGDMIDRAKAAEGGGAYEMTPAEVAEAEAKAREMAAAEPSEPPAMPDDEPEADRGEDLSYGK